MRAMFGWTTFGKVKFKDTIFDTDIAVDIEMNAHERAVADHHSIGVEEIRSLLTPDVEAIVIGTGQQGIAKLTKEAYDLIAHRQLELHIDESPRAIKDYNEICTTKKTVAIIHVTC
jgi:hypothetical protein